MKKIGEHGQRQQLLARLRSSAMRYGEGTSVDPEDSRVISSTRNRSLWSLVYFIPVALLAGNASAGVASPLGARGHATLPEVQKFDPGGSDFQFGEGWRLRL